jgi:hypothetical protein
VEIVDCGELGSGGKGCALEASEVLFAATTTAKDVRWCGIDWEGFH